MNEYDVVVIGAGPGGYVCAIRAAQLGLKTAIIDKQWLGGVCLNVGCIPSKALLRNADIAHILRERGKDFGFSFENLSLDFPAAVKRSRQVADRHVRGVGYLMKKNKVDVYMGEAKMTGRNAIRVTDKDGKVTELSTKNTVIATGARAALIPGVEADGEKVVTYLEAIQQTTLPKSVIIIGAGAIGVELLREQHWQRETGIEFIIDCNAQQPLGVAGIQASDRAIDRSGKLIFGALGIGALKLKLHRACISQLFERPDQVLDAEQIYALAKAMA